MFRHYSYEIEKYQKRRGVVPTSSSSGAPVQGNLTLQPPQQQSQQQQQPPQQPQSQPHQMVMGPPVMNPMAGPMGYYPNPMAHMAMMPMGMMHNMPMNMNMGMPQVGSGAALGAIYNMPSSAGNVNNVAGSRGR